MSLFLRGPSRVLVVAPPDPGEDDVNAIGRRSFSNPVSSAEVREAEGAERGPVAARRVESTDDALAALDGDERFGCVVTTASRPEAASSLVAAVRDADPHLPVIAYPANGSERLAAAVTGAGATDYLPRGDDPDRERLLDRVDRALGEYDRRWRDARESEMFDYVLRNLDHILYVKDDRGRHLKFSDQCHSPDPEAVIGRTDAEVYGDDAAAEAIEDDRRVLDGESIVEKTERWSDDTGTRWYETTKIPWLEGGDVVGLVGMTEEVTDRKRKEVALEEFVDYVSHDLRNPLNVASGFVDLARDAGDDAALDHAESALDRMDQMIDDLTALAQNSTEQSAGVESAAIAPLARDVWSVVGTDAATLDLDVPPESALTAPEPQVRPLFENLLKNAVEHGATDAADDADRDVTVRVGLLNDGFYVEDDGPGIPESRRDAVFEEGHTTSPDGSGIGLAIVAEIARAREWDVELTESDAGGARFEFRNCLVVAEPERPAATGERAAIAANADVGDPKIDGETTVRDDGRVTVRGAGRNVWRDVNEFQFAYVEVDGPVRVEARVESLDGPNPHSKAGVMVRESLDEAAPFGYVGAIESDRTETLWRSERGDSTRSQHVDDGAGVTERYRIDRVDDRVTCSVSDSVDGEEWIPIDQRRVALGDTAYVGLAVGSVVADQHCTATFSDVEVVGLDA